LSSPTTRSKALLEKRGYLVAIVEKVIPHSFIKIDLFGFGDLLAVKPGMILLVQTTSASNITSRVKKIEAHDNYPMVLASGMLVEVHGWRKPANSRRWEVTIRTPGVP